MGQLADELADMYEEMTDPELRAAALQEQEREQYVEEIARDSGL